MIEKLWLYPPLAIAHVGSSPIPCDNFSWGPNPNPNNAFGKTVIVPEETLHVADDGTITSTIPEKVIFSDENGIRPICPFFELFGQWTSDNVSHQGPITPEILESFDLSLSDVMWNVKVANLKAFKYTQEASDKIIATKNEVIGDDTKSYQLLGISLEDIDEEDKILPTGINILLGSFQLTKSTDKFPGLRLRFTPGKGDTYGPEDLNDKPSGSSFGLPEERRKLNPSAKWCNYLVGNDDQRNVPPFLYARETYDQMLARQVRTFPERSLGIIDDTCDGIISCTIKNTTLAAFSRIVVGPPNYAPDRRHLTSLADGLKDRVSRNNIFDPSYVSNDELTIKEIHDFLERVLETMSNVNVDYLNLIRRDNIDNPNNNPFPVENGTPTNKLPLTTTGIEKHLGLVNGFKLGVPKQTLIGILTLIVSRLRKPPDHENEIFAEIYRDGDTLDRRPGKMPALLRGSDVMAMHITRRQYNLITEYLKKLQEEEPNL